jgi:hypothetical protein
MSLWKKKPDGGHRIGWLGLLSLLVLFLTALTIALPATDAAISDPALRFVLLIAVLGLLLLMLMRALYPEPQVHYVEVSQADDLPTHGNVAMEKDWFTLYIELRKAARRRLEIRHRLEKDELDNILASPEAGLLVKDQKVMELLTCDLKRRYMWPGADLEATFVDLLGRVEALE